MGVTYRHKILVFDIETSLGEAYFFHPKVRFITHKMVKENPIMLCWAASFIGEDEVHSEMLTVTELKKRDDGRIVKKLAELMQEADYVLAHNGDQFDIPWVRGRLWANGLDEQPLGYVQSIDTKKAAAKDFRLPHNNLEALARHRGFGLKDKMDLDDWIAIAKGDHTRLKKMQEYNIGDVRILRDVFESMLPHMERLPRLVSTTEEFSCPWCGNDVKNMQKRGVKKHSPAYSYQRYWCKPPKGCGRYPREKTHDRTNQSSLRAN